MMSCVPGGYVVYSRFCSSKGRGDFYSFHKKRGFSKKSWVSINTDCPLNTGFNLILQN
jgi:hypothetical protein